MLATRNHRSATLARSGTLVLLLVLALLFLFDRGTHLVFGGISFLLLGIYHLLTDYRYTPEKIRASGLLVLHIAIYLLLCTLVIWTTTGVDESPYWIIYSIPIIVAATNLGLLPTLATCISSFSIYTAITYSYLPSEKTAEETPEVLVFGLMLLTVGVLVQTFSEQNRRQLLHQRELNEKLLEQQEVLKESLARLETAEESLRRKERLAALGEMSAGIAHEIRNPLGIITSSAQLLGKKIPEPGSGVGRLLDIIQEEAARLNGLISDFLTFGRPAPPKLLFCDITAELQRALAHVEGMAKNKGVDLRADLPEEPLYAPADQEMLMQVFLNLLLNALDATEAGDFIEARLSREDGMLRVEIRDTGCGIPEENLTRVFNPFFTTKEKGTGLGLANAHKLVEAHRGEILVRSRAGEGTVFTVRLPAEAS